jgi:hypothetical protein
MLWLSVRIFQYTVLSKDSIRVSIGRVRQKGTNESVESLFNKETTQIDAAVPQQCRQSSKLHSDHENFPAPSQCSATDTSVNKLRGARAVVMHLRDTAEQRRTFNACGAKLLNEFFLLVYRFQKYSPCRPFCNHVVQV